MDASALTSLPEMGGDQLLALAELDGKALQALVPLRAGTCEDRQICLDFLDRCFATGIARQNLQNRYLQ